jgi:hypothetical protein
MIVEHEGNSNESASESDKGIKEVITFTSKSDCRVSNMKGILKNPNGRLIKG